LLRAILAFLNERTWLDNKNRIQIILNVIEEVSMNELFLFRPCNHSIGCKQSEKNVWIYKLSDVYKTGMCLVGHMSFPLAIEQHPNWQFMTDAEYKIVKNQPYPGEIEELYPII
jgi:hypothetical protein